MKRLTMVTTLMFMVITGTAQAASDTATITITGKVLANTCSIDSSSATQTITLPTISDRDITGIGAIDSAKTAVPIILRNCGATATSVVVNTSGKAHGVTPELFDNIIASNTAGRAGGFGIYFYHTNGSDLFFPNGSSRETIRLTPSVDNILTFYATYGVATASVTPGNISAVVNMTFDYQ